MIRGFCHLYVGQEAIAVGMEAGLTKEDTVIQSYREHCNYMARGDSPYRIMAEQCGKSTGSTKGKGGSMHFYSRKNNFYGGHGIIGAQIPLGTGLAFALKYKKTKNVSFTIFGDGCANQGQIYEAANMAGLWKLPVVYVTENNRYGMGTAVNRASYYTPFYSRYRGFPGMKVDGFNIFSVREATKWAKNFVLEHGPLFMEIDTYRYQGHSMADQGLGYRTREEVNQVRQTRDGIEFIRHLLIDNSLATESELKDIEKQVKQELEDAIERIKSDPYPESSELYTNVYTHDTPFIRGIEYNQSIFNTHKV
jgi:pyruvate dehydrogenase E1 component alpha subunit